MLDAGSYRAPHRLLCDFWNDRTLMDQTAQTAVPNCLPGNVWRLDLVTVDVLARLVHDVLAVAVVALVDKREAGAQRVVRDELVLAHPPCATGMGRPTRLSHGVFACAVGGKLNQRARA